MKTSSDPHLQPQWLLRHMPRLLVVASFVTMVLMWVGVSWRLEQAKQASLDSAARTASAINALFSARVEERFQRATQALFAARLVSGSPAALAEAVADRLGVNLPGATVVIADPTGKVLLSSDSALAGVRVAPAWRSLERKPSGEQAPLSLLLNGQRHLVLEAPFSINQQPAHLLIGYSEDSLTNVARDAIGNAAGHVSLRISGETAPLFDHIVGAVAAGELDNIHEERALAFNVRSHLDVPRAWALKYHYASAVPATITISVLLGLVSWAVFITAAIGFKRALLAQQELTKLVALDALTGLPNRRTFTNLLAQGLAHTRRTKAAYGLLFIDLDNFKHVNDTHGHDAGDVLLKEVAKRLSGAVRASDYVCRLGGDEFVVLLTALDQPKDAEEVARRILASLNEPIHLGDTDLHMGASLGIAVAPQDAQTASQLVMCADMAVYRAKAEGKGCFAFFDPSLREKAEARSRISRDIRRGIDTGEFFLVYQPKMALKGRATTGFEALLRWRHPQLGMLQPGEFIPVAEETGLIEDLGGLVMRTAVKQLRQWHEESRGWRTVAVNVSARQLRDGQLARRVAALLHEHKVPGRCLQIELTESMLALDEETASEIIRELKKLGVTISVDDFGTGYSSLSALQRYDVDYLKIDRSFVRDIEENADSLEICRAIVQMGHALKVKTIAEGIETPGQYAALLQLGCDEGQGYFMAKPMEADDAIHWTRPPSDFADSTYDIEV